MEQQQQQQQQQQKGIMIHDSILDALIIVYDDCQYGRGSDDE
jgi:hypothetical protein